MATWRRRLPYPAAGAPTASSCCIAEGARRAKPENARSKARALAQQEGLEDSPMMRAQSALQEAEADVTAWNGSISQGSRFTEGGSLADGSSLAAALSHDANTVAVPQRPKSPWELEHRMGSHMVAPLLPRPTFLRQSSIQNRWIRCMQQS